MRKAATIGSQSRMVLPRTPPRMRLLRLGSALIFSFCLFGINTAHACWGGREALSEWGYASYIRLSRHAPSENSANFAFWGFSEVRRKGFLRRPRILTAPSLIPRAWAASRTGTRRGFVLGRSVARSSQKPNGRGLQSEEVLSYCSPANLERGKGSVPPTGDCG